MINRTNVSVSILKAAQTHMQRLVCRLCSFGVKYIYIYGTPTCLLKARRELLNPSISVKRGELPNLSF